MPTARTKANRKWNEKAYDRVVCWLPKGEKDTLKQVAHDAGISMNEYIKQAISEKMNGKQTTE